MHLENLLAITAMAVVTYLTRIGGYVLLRNRTLSRRMSGVMDAAPGCVLIAVIAPHFVTPHHGDLLALAVTVAAATRLSLLPTVLIGVASSALLRQLGV